MNAVTRLDANRLRKWRTLPIGVRLTLYAVGGLVALALLFQFFLRYQYVEDHGVVWRVDRLTQEMCQVGLSNTRCTMPFRHHTTVTSTSLSTSTSTSISTSAKPPSRRR